MTQILSVRTEITFDVSDAPIYKADHYPAIFPKTLTIKIFPSGEMFAPVVTGKRIKKDGDESQAISSPYVSSEDRRNVPWIRDAIALAELYVENAKRANSTYQW